MKRPTVKKDIKEATEAVKEIMRENLSLISEGMIEQIMSKYNSLTDSQRFNAIKDIKAKGINTYKEKLLNAYAVIAADALKKVRKEVPKKQNVRLTEINEDALALGEFDSLPKDLQKRIKTMLDLMIGTQIADLEKVVFFQYTSAVDSTDSADLLRNDLESSVTDFISGNAVNAGAGAASSQIINEARLAFFLDPEVEQEVEAFEFVNEDPVSPICNDLAGTVFAKDDPNLNRYWPPLHFNCKSWIRAILVGNLGNKEIKSFEPSKASLEKFIQFSEQRAKEYFGGLSA